MENKLEIFASNEFGSLRTLECDGKVMFVASDVAKMLGYARPADAVTAHFKGSVKYRLPTNGGMQELKIIPEGDVYRLIAHSKLPAAEKFESWVFDEVLPSIRKTGSYTTNPVDGFESKRLSIMERNAKVKEAELWSKLAADSTGTYHQICKVYAVNTLAGKEVVALPKVTAKTYTATEVGEMLGISANKVGKIAKQNGLKVEQYGSWYHDKSRYSSKEVESFRYNDNGIEAIRMAIAN